MNGYAIHIISKTITILRTYSIGITGAISNPALIAETVGTNLNNNVISTKLEDLKYFF